MARYTGSVCRQCRREGIKLFLKGERCYSDKCAVVKHPYPPGQHGQRRTKVSEFGLQLREKQKARRTYGVLERQFRNYFAQADRRKGVTGEILLQILESRLDNVIYRMGFGRSRAEARQLIGHGHFEVNGRKVDRPSFLTEPGEVIAVREKSKGKDVFKQIKESLEQTSTVEWLEVDRENMTGKIVAVPSREEIDVPIVEHLIVEMYSR